MTSTFTDERQTAELREIASSFRDSFQTIEDMSLHFIREAIARGILRPGERIQQDAIAELLGVSRMPVRSSLRKLESEGLVVFSAHRGASVRLLTAKELAEIYDLRIMLETYALGEAAKRLTPDALRELERLAKQMRREKSSTRGIGYRDQFYRRLYGLAGLPRTSELIFKLRAEVGPCLVLGQVTEESQDHAAMLEYLVAGDVAGAKQWLRQHLGTVSKELQRLLAEG